MGSVTNPTGSVNGKDLSTLVDCYAGNWGGIIHSVGGAMAQWNYVAPLLSDHTDPCAYEGSGAGFRPGEVTLRITIVGFAPAPADAPVFPPPGDLPLTLQVGQNPPTSDGVTRVVNAYVQQATRQGKSGNDTTATSGTVTFTQLDAAAHAGSYDLTFPNGGHTAGSFSAPWCGALPS